MKLHVDGSRISLRPAIDTDEQFLRSLYYNVRAPELALVPWSEEQRVQFANSQFDAQTSHYRIHYSTASFDIVEVDNIPAGRFTIDYGSSEITIVDMALIPEYRNQGIGTSLLLPLLARSERENKKIVLHVEVFNPAMHLYGRLGFNITATDNVYYSMERVPQMPSAALC